MRFQEKKILVTGAGHGIGLAVTRAFLYEGARVTINHINPDWVAEAMKKMGNQSCDVAGDVADTGQARSVVSQAESELGGLDIVVSNAGIYPSHAFLEMDVNDWDRVMAAFFSINRSHIPGEDSKGLPPVHPARAVEVTPSAAF